MSATNFSSGATNVTNNNVLGQLKIFDPTINHTYSNDFDVFNSSNDWIVTKTNSGATNAIINGDGGILLLTNTASLNDIIALQLANATFTFQSGKKFYFKSRFQVADANLTALVMGMQIVTTTPFSGVSNGVYFQKASGSTSLSFNTTASSTTTSANNILSISNSNYFTVGFYYDGKSNLNYYASNDSSSVNSSPNPTYLGHLATTNLPASSQNMTISFAIQNGAAAAKTMSIDYIFVSKER